MVSRCGFRFVEMLSKGPSGRVLASVMLLTGLVFTSAPGVVVQAAPFTVTVTTTADSNNGCATSGAAPCSLRDAIRFANSNYATTITVPAGVFTLAQAGRNEDAAATGDLDITADVTINGAGADRTVIDGGGIDRVFDVWGGTLTMQGLTVRNGDATNDPNDAAGGGIYVRIHFTGLRLTGVNVRNNKAVYGGGMNLLSNTGSMSITDSVIDGNSATYRGGGIRYAGESMRIERSTISHNTADLGGGLLHDVGEHLSIVNSTISGNSATFGGGVFDPAAFRITYVSSTITGNSASTAGGGIYASGPYITDPPGFSLAILDGIIIANNGGQNCSLHVGYITSQGHNLDSDDTCGLSESTDLRGVDARLGTLANNGGPTQTHALLAGSPATDRGTCIYHDPATNQDATLATDQRGVARPQGAACDIGAYEAQAITLAVTGVSPATGSITGGTSVTITGTGFAPGATVTIGGTAATNVVVNGAGTSIAATTTKHAAGTVSVVVTNPDGKSATLSNAFTYAPPGQVSASQPLLVVVPGIVNPLQPDACQTATAWANGAFTNMLSYLWDNIYPAYRYTGPTVDTLYFNYHRASDTSCAPDKYNKVDTYKKVDGRDTADADKGSADLLNDQISAEINKRQKAGTPVSRVDIVAHSLGGVVAAAYVHKYPPQIPTTIVTFDSPLNGCMPMPETISEKVCDLAAILGTFWSGTQAAAELTDGTFLASLRQAWTAPHNTAFYSVADTADLVVHSSQAVPLGLDSTHVLVRDTCGQWPYEQLIQKNKLNGSWLCHGSVLNDATVNGWLDGVLLPQPKTSP